jgi:preprotein translocase subunit Sss1
MQTKRFSELQEEFFSTSKRLRLAQKPEEKLALLNELQRIVQESKRVLTEPDSEESK